jgi:hypothetical protein
MSSVLVLGGYGSFGQRIVRALLLANIPVIIVGRNKSKASALRDFLLKENTSYNVDIAVFDVHTALAEQLEKTSPKIVINAVGPFQQSGYTIAKICIAHQVHYLDLADGREFVTSIKQLDDIAKRQKVCVISGASTVPCLSSAVIEHYQSQFSKIDSLVYGISPGQKTPRGLATAKAVLSYLGKPLKPHASSTKIRYGWQDLYRQHYPKLGKRWMANCDIPDMDLFPEKYGIKQLRFSAGMENGLLHILIWFLSYAIRFGFPFHLISCAERLLKWSHYFDRFGTSNGGMHMLMQGKGLKNEDKQINWFIISKQGDGPQIPCVPAIVLAKKLYHNQPIAYGAYPCVGQVSLTEYLQELTHYAIETVEVS